MPTTDSGVVYLTAEDVREVHLGLAEDFRRAGSPFTAGVLHQDGLESAVQQPRQAFGGADLYPDLFAKAAALARGIICGHLFLDGNKRTGMEAAILFLEYNGSQVDLASVLSQKS